MAPVRAHQGSGRDDAFFLGEGDGPEQSPKVGTKKNPGMMSFVNTSNFGDVFLLLVVFVGI